MFCRQKTQWVLGLNGTQLFQNKILGIYMKIDTLVHFQRSVSPTQTKMEMHDRACKSYMEHAKVEGEHVCKNVSLISNDLDIMPCHAMPCHAMPCRVMRLHLYVCKIYILVIISFTNYTNIQYKPCLQTMIITVNDNNCLFV